MCSPSRQRTAKRRKTLLFPLWKTCRRICGVLFVKSTSHDMLQNILFDHIGTRNTVSLNGLGACTTLSTKGLVNSNSVSRKLFEFTQRRTQSRAADKYSPNEATTKSTFFLHGGEPEQCERRSEISDHFENLCFCASWCFVLCMRLIMV